MDPFLVFEQNLIEMLNHLYDPIYRPSEKLWMALHVNRDSGLQALRDAILSGIEELKPAANVPPSALSWRIYGMLHYRYVEGLPQEVTADKLGITARHLRRSYADAIHALSLTLWEKSGGASPAPPSNQGRETPEPITNLPVGNNIPLPVTAISWQEQLARELEALEETEAGSVSNISEIFDYVVRIASHLTRQYGIQLTAQSVSPRLMAAIHHSVLCQILISVIDQLVKQMESGELQLTAAADQGQVQINISGTLLPDGAVQDFEPIQELLTPFDIGLTTRELDGGFQLSIELLQVDRCVLVVDDNPDMAHLYRRYLAGTRYYLQHVNRGEKTFEAIDLYRPDLVVLDVMLPDIDGWDLLTRLHENPETRPLPVLICSVMREKELAFSLGARYFLSKPVQRQDFIKALNLVLQQP
jgi:CheY-like chemotaxis protein